MFVACQACMAMNISTRQFVLSASFAISLFSVLLQTVDAAVKPTEPADSKPLPEIWQKVPAQQRLMALRAAEVDATRLLIERIMGLHLNSDSTVRDLTLANDTIRGNISASIKGVTTTEAPEYFDDGRLQVVRAVKIQQVIEVLSKIVKQEHLSDGVIKTIADSQKTELVTRNENLDAVGSSAIPGSEGHLKIKAKRAAEADAYRKLGERLMGVKITSDTTVRDLALKNDEVIKSMSGLIKGADVTAIQFQKDSSCEVTMQVKLSEVIRTVTRVIKGKTHLEDSLESKIVSETGTGVASKELGTASPVESGSDVTEVQISETLRRVILEIPASN
jgi:hypothetical protein